METIIILHKGESLEAIKRYEVFTEASPMPNRSLKLR